MTVAQLTEYLKEYPLDMEIAIKSYEGISSGIAMTIVPIKYNENTDWYYDEHEIVTENKADTTVLTFF